MTTRMNNQNFQKAVELINKSTSVLITTHTKVDGDAVGCCVAMSEALSTLGKKPQILFLSPLPDWYGFLLRKARSRPRQGHFKRPASTKQIRPHHYRRYQ